MDYIRYHLQSALIKDIDPSNDCLLYIADRFELSMEQRYWLAFLYSTCYSATTVFFVYNEFPDFENVNVPRLQRWWDNNKHKTVFQTDRLRIKTGNKFVATFESYRDWIGSGTQEEKFKSMDKRNEKGNYLRAYKAVREIKNIGRFTAFIYLEMVHVLTNFKCQPDRLEWKEADACREGMCQALKIDLDSNDYDLMDMEMIKFKNALEKLGCEQTTIFNLETTLCAYKKYKQGRRYIGYYIDRQGDEIEKMKGLVPEGVAWRVLDEFREETYDYVRNKIKNDLFNNRELRHRKDLGYAAAFEAF